MTSKTVRTAMLSVSAAALISAASISPALAQGAQVDADDLAGVVTGASGPEAGVWVIAETRDLPTRYIKIVVTDDRGRYLMPDLPKANYDIWVRGYGLVDSPKVKSAPGKTLDLKAMRAPSDAAAAAVLSGDLLVVDAEDPGCQDLPGHGTLRQRHSGRAARSGPVAALSQDRRLQRLSPARRQGDARAAAGARPFRHVRRRRGNGASNRASRAR